MQVKFCGHAVTARELELIEGVISSCTGLSRTELARTVCELLGWRRALKSRECWALLEQLEAAGEVALPARRQTKPKGARTRVARSARGEPAPALNAPLGELTPLSLTLVASPEPAVARAGRSLPLPGPRGPLRRPSALPGERHAPNGATGRLLAVLQRRVASRRA